MVVEEPEVHIYIVLAFTNTTKVLVTETLTVCHYHSSLISQR